MEKIILYYKYVAIPDTESVRLWQKALCESLGLKGRILISEKGINGTLGGDLSALKKYKRGMNEHSLFKKIAYKWSDGHADDFPRLSIKVRSETVTLGWEPDVDKKGVVGTGKHLKPADIDSFMREHPEAVFFDGRNNYESAIGKFKNAITPNVRRFKEMPVELEKPEYDELKGKPVVTYCTGGIRCESLSALMKKKGFKDVYQIDGGIVQYGQEVGDKGLWEGKCFVFDKRMHVSFSDDSADIGSCTLCGTTTSRYINCANMACNELILVCEDCNQYTTCSKDCERVAALQT